MIPPPRGVPTMAWNAWNTFSSNGKPLRGGRKEYQVPIERSGRGGLKENVTNILTYYNTFYLFNFLTV